ncbi:MAG: hypothetical protein V3575_04065 [Candidatus Absconditabacteria bacterium]
MYIEGLDEIKEEILWKILETGIGHEKASKIVYIQYKKPGNSDSMQISKLGDYIDWFLGRE